MGGPHEGIDAGEEVRLSSPLRRQSEDRLADLPGYKVESMKIDSPACLGPLARVVVPPCCRRPAAPRGGRTLSDVGE